MNLIYIAIEIALQDFKKIFLLSTYATGTNSLVIAASVNISIDSSSFEEVSGASYGR